MNTEIRNQKSEVRSQNTDENNSVLSYELTTMNELWGWTLMQFKIQNLKFKIVEEEAPFNVIDYHIFLNPKNTKPKLEIGKPKSKIL